MALYRIENNLLPDRILERFLELTEDEALKIKYVIDKYITGYIGNLSIEKIDEE